MTPPHRFIKNIIFLIFLVLYASVSAAADHPDPSMIAPTQSTRMSIDESMEPMPVSNDEYFKEYDIDWKRELAAPTQNHLPVGSLVQYLNVYLRGQSSGSIYKSGEESKWSIEPSLVRLSLNPLTDIRNLMLTIQYRF